MKDQFFTGSSVEAALEAASVALGLPQARLQYVVLERETASRFGLSATPARIAVLLDAPPRTAARVPVSPARDPRAARQALIAALALSVGQEIQADDLGDRERRTLSLRGPGCELLFDPAGGCFRALEYLLGRIGAAEGEVPPRLVCETYRQARDAWLESQAHELGRGVLADGLQRETEPMNAYDRRLIHTAIDQLDGLSTRSVGEGAARRVTIFLAAQHATP